MNRLKRMIVCTLLATTALSVQAHAQVQAPPSFAHELARLEAALTVLEASAGPGHGSSSGPVEASVDDMLLRPPELVQSMLRDLEGIDRVLPSSWPGDASYVAAFGSYADIIEAVARADPAVADSDRVQILRDLHQQLRELRQTLRLKPVVNAPMDVVRTVAVSVRAIANGLEVKGLQVRCTPFALRKTHPDLIEFKGLTTTAGEPLMPGRYRFRIFRGKEVLSAGTYAVGLGGERTETIELPVTVGK